MPAESYLTKLNEFICGFGDIAMQVFNKSNFLKLTKNEIDENIIYQNENLMRAVLSFLVNDCDIMPDDIYLAYFGSSVLSNINNKIKNSTGSDLKNLYESVINYLFID